MNNTINQGCNKVPYKDLYDEFTTYSFFGGLLEYFFDPLDSQIRGERLNTGYVVNRTFAEIAKWMHPVERRLHFRVFDHIRVTEEVLVGIFDTTNKEFELIFPRFMKEFMLGSVYVVYSNELRIYELQLAEKLARENNQDPLDRVERSVPNSNFRLLKRVVDKDGNFGWDAVLSQVKNINIDNFLPEIDGEVQQPIRFSFNEGFMFIRLFEIFRRYEAQMQTHFRLFQLLHTAIEIDIDDYEQFMNKASQFTSPNVISYNLFDSDVSMPTVKDLKLVDKMPMLSESYQNIQLLLNDSLGRLGLAVDDSSKRERITVGENARALQPTMNFQNSVMHALRRVTRRLQLHFNKKVDFINTSEQREARMTGMNISKFNKYKDEY